MKYIEIYDNEIDDIIRIQRRIHGLMELRKPGKKHEKRTTNNK